MEGFISIIVGICILWPVISYIYRTAKATKAARDLERSTRELKRSVGKLAGSFIDFYVKNGNNANAIAKNVLDFNDGKPYVVEWTVKVIPALLAYICKSSGYDKNQLKENGEKYVNELLIDEMYHALKNYELNPSFIRNNVNSVIDAVYNNEIADNLLKKRIIEFFSLGDENQEGKIANLNVFLCAICPFDLNLNDSFKFYLYSFFEEYGLEESEIREELLEFGVSS